MYDCQILADSLSSRNIRLTTFRVTFPRIILAEVNTHRMLSRNSASSRAVPVERTIAGVKNDPFIPQTFGSNQKGMVAGDPLDEKQTSMALEWWRIALANAVYEAGMLNKVGVHKSLSNRPLEPYKWHTAILSATDWNNLFALRCAKDAQAEFQVLANMMKEAYDNNEPKQLSSGQWHLPGVDDDEIDDEAMSYPDPYVDWEMWIKVAVGRVAGVSFERTEKRERELDIKLYDRLASGRPPHLSPFEHVARPFTEHEWEVVYAAQEVLGSRYADDPFAERLYRQLEYCGNFHGFVQRRAEIHNEHDASLLLS